MKLLIAAIALAGVSTTKSSSSKFHRHLNESSEAVGSKAGKEAAAGKAAKGNSNFYGYGSMSYPTPVPAPTVVPTLNLCAREVVGTFDLFGDGQCVDFDDKKFNGVGVGYDDNLDRCMSTCKCVGGYTDVRGIELFDEETYGKLCICLVDVGSLEILEFVGLMCEADIFKYDDDPAAWATGVVARAAASAERPACCYGVPFFRLPSSQPSLSSSPSVQPSSLPSSQPSLSSSPSVQPSSLPSSQPSLSSSPSVQPSSLPSSQPSLSSSPSVQPSSSSEPSSSSQPSSSSKPSVQPSLSSSPTWCDFFGKCGKTLSSSSAALRCYDKSNLGLNSPTDDVGSNLEQVNQEADDELLVSCLSTESSITKESISTECENEMYDVAVSVVPGPHFFLIATKSPDSSSNVICPTTLAFDSLNFEKKIAAPYEKDFKDLPRYELKTAVKLIHLLEAEEIAEAPDASNFNVLTNSCVHYASKIWRPLGVDETEDLADFIVVNIINNENLLNLWEGEGEGVRRLAWKAPLVQAVIEGKMKKIVSSQLHLNK